MADNEKQYLDAEGLRRLKEYIDNQLSPLRDAINLLTSNDKTPGSIQAMIDNAINEITHISGGSAPEEEREENP